MIKKITIVVLIILFQLNTHCQMKNEVPEFHVDISHPANKYEVTPVFDYIKTLEGIPASLPYGSSSGSWASSGSSWTAQKGTPIGFEITYFSWCENKYYHIDQNFDKEYMIEMTKRCYSNSSDEFSEVADRKEFIYKENLEKIKDNNSSDHSYSAFDTLVFGFAPQGMIVVWMQYGGGNLIEINRFQAEEVIDEERLQECKEKLLSTYRINESIYDEQRLKTMHIENVSSQEWDNYRTKYNWNYKVISDNEKFKLLCFSNDYFNGERETNLRPVILNPTMKKRAIPAFMFFCWETSAKDRYLSRVFFNWEKINKLLENSEENNVFIIQVSKDNNEIQVLLNETPIEVDSIRIYPNSSMRFRDSY